MTVNIKQKHLLLFFIVCFAIDICKAKDSTIVFKIGIGINYNKPKAYEDYFYRKSTSTGPYSYISYNEERRYKEPTSYSPSLNFLVQKQLNNTLGLSLQVSYTYSSRKYSTHQSSQFNYWYPWSSSVIDSSVVNNYQESLHFVPISIGVVVHYKKIYFIPKFDLTYLHLITKSNKQVHRNNSDETTTSETKKNELIIGFGGTIGIDFKVKKLNPFIELQSDLYNQTKLFQRNGLNISLALGIKL